jgi:hypothetical protein
MGQSRLAKGLFQPLFGFCWMGEIAFLQLKLPQLLPDCGGCFPNDRFHASMSDKMGPAPGQNVPAGPFGAFGLILMPPPNVSQAKDHFIHILGRPAAWQTGKDV